MCVHAKVLSRVQLFATLWTVAHQAPLSMGFPKQEYWSGLPFPSPGDLPNLKIKLTSLESLALEDGFFTIEPPGMSFSRYRCCCSVAQLCPTLGHHMDYSMPSFPVLLYLLELEIASGNNKQQKIDFLDRMKIFLYSIYWFVTVKKRTICKKEL